MPPATGRKVLTVAICWLTFCDALMVQKPVNSSVLRDSLSAESLAHFYKNLPLAVYARGSPYSPIRFAPGVVYKGPLTAGSQQASVAVPGSGLKNNNAFLKSLKDSYGKFLASPQIAAFKAAFPQQFLPIQALPAHLTQPLVAAATPHLQYRPLSFAVGSQYKLPSLYSAATTPQSQYGYVSGYAPHAGSLPSVSSSSYPYSSEFSGPTIVQKPKQANSNYGNAAKVEKLHQQVQPQQTRQAVPVKAALATAHTHAQRGTQGNSGTHHGHSDNGQIQASPAQTSVTAIVNGKKTLVTLETKPPIPHLVDLSLLEPLHFDNPVVPQVQHFLPKINPTTFNRLPVFNVQDASKTQMGTLYGHSISYNSPSVQSKPKQEKKNKIKHQTQNVSVKPQIVIKGNPDGEEFSYEINMPGHKETYNEQVVSYNKNTNSPPVTISYNKQTQNEPQHYSYTHQSKEPPRVRHMQYVNNESPVHNTYSPEEQQQQQQHKNVPQEESTPENSYNESSDTQGQDEESSHYRDNGLGEEHSEDNDEYHQRHLKYADGSANQNTRDAPGANADWPHGNDESDHEENYSHSESPSYSHSHEKNQGDHYSQHESPYSSSHQEFQPQHYSSHAPPKASNRPHHHTLQPQYTDYSPNNKPPTGSVYTESPRQAHDEKAEHRGQEYKQPQQILHSDIVYNMPLPTYYQQPVTMNLQGNYQPAFPGFQNVVLVPTTVKYNAPIKVDPNQHVQLGPSTQFYFNSQSSPAPQKLAQQNVSPTPSPKPGLYLSSSSGQFGPGTSGAYSTMRPVIYNGPELELYSSQEHTTEKSTPPPHVNQKSKQVTNEEKEESPDKMHSLMMQQAVAEMSELEENDEENFEKAYKQAAFGFPAYHEETETDSYDKDDSNSYDSPSFSSGTDGEHTPFEKYVKEGNDFPKSTRAAYQDMRQDTKEDYLLDYSVNKPTIYADYYKHKADYFKNFKNNRPPKPLFESQSDDSSSNNNKEQKNAKYVISTPSFAYPSFKPIPKAKDDFFAQYKTAPKNLEYNYTKAAPRDSSTNASGPFHKYRSQFVEPLYHYGFEPVVSPIVLDSELAAMASNDSPDSENPATRKKVYKENWYLKKTSTSAGKPS